MATPDNAPLASVSRADVAGLATLWPKSSSALAVHIVEPMHVLSLRHLPGRGSSSLLTVMAAHALPGLPEPGRSYGIEPRLIWRSPNETLLLTQDPRQASALLATLRPASGALAFALDLSSGTLVAKLQGCGVAALLSRLVDAQTLPREAGEASRVRLVDIAAVVWCESPDHVGLLVDRANDHYLARWLKYAADAV